MSTPYSPATDSPMHTRPTLTMRPSIKPQECEQNASSRKMTSIKSADIQDKKRHALQDIIGHSANDNHTAAEILKGMLSQSIDSETTFTSECDTIPKAPLADGGLDEYLQDVCIAASQRMIRTAFEHVYSDRAGGYRFSESGSQDQTGLWEQLNNHVLGRTQPALSSRGSRRAALLAAHPYSSKEASYEAANYPPVPLRESTGESVSRSQERGAGVIGNPVSLSKELGIEVLQTEVGCDLPLYRGQELCANFDSHLPNLAFHHPARSWNSIIHALEPHKQPIIKWDYHRISREDDDAHTIARLTLIIPPQHPSLKDHPLRIAIPETPYSKECTAVVDTLGGMKSWAGGPRMSKASAPVDEVPDHQVEAQNAALVTAMTDGAISWVLHPDIRDIPMDHDSEAGFQAPRMRDDDTPKPCRAYLRQVFDHVIRPHPDHVWVETMTGKGSHQWSMGDCAYVSEGQTGLRLGIGEHIQEYRVYTTCPDDSDNIESVCKLAIELNVVGFIKWVGRHCFGVGLDGRG